MGGYYYARKEEEPHGEMQGHCHHQSEGRRRQDHHYGQLGRGAGTAREEKVLLVDTDPQGSLTVSLGVKNPDELDTTISDLLQVVVGNGNLSPLDNGILKDIKGVDLVPSKIGLSSFEISLVNTMSREFVLRSYLGAVKRDYDYVLIDCMPSLGMLTINALAAADSVLIPCQANLPFHKGLEIADGISCQGQTADQPGSENRRYPADYGRQPHQQRQKHHRRPAADREQSQGAGYRDTLFCTGGSAISRIIRFM